MVKESAKNVDQAVSKLTEFWNGENDKESRYFGPLLHQPCSRDAKLQERKSVLIVRKSTAFILLYVYIPIKLHLNTLN